jgi:hypothetical protein
MPWRAVIVTLVLMGVAVGAMAGFGVFQETRSFRPEIRVVLTKLTDGRAEELYDEGTSRAFRETVLKDKFLAMSDQVRKTLGAFEQLGEVQDVDINDGETGRTSRVSIELEFEHGRTRGELSFHQRRGQKGWLLLGISIAIPDDLLDKAAALRMQYDEIKAPAEVIDKVTEILGQIRDGSAGAVHEGASEPFKKTLTGAEFREKVAGLRADLGPFVRVLAIISSAQNADKNKAKVSALIEFERDKTTGTFGFVKAPSGARNKTRSGTPSEIDGGEDGETEWMLSYFKIDIPEIDLPSRGD